MNVRRERTLARRIARRTERTATRMIERRTARAARPARRTVAGNTLALMLLTAVASATLWPVYHSSQFVVLVVVAFALGAGIAILGATFRWPAWIVILVTLGGYLLTGVPLAVPDQAVNGLLPTAAGLTELLAATALGWKRLLTIVVPVGAYQALLVPALILVLLSTVVGLSTALRARIGELAVLAPSALFFAGILFGPIGASAPIELGLGFFMLLLFWLLWFRGERRRAIVRVIAAQSPRTIESAIDRRMSAARGLVSASVIIAVALAVGTAAAIAVPALNARDVLRVRVQQPFDPRDYPSPLSGFRGYLQDDTSGETLLTVRGLPRGGRLRLATLDSYDGIVYSVGSEAVPGDSGSFTRLPYRLDQGAVRGDEVALSVTVGAYEGVWVPGAGQLEQIDFGGTTATARADAFYYNDNSGSAAVLTGLKRGDSYRSESVVPRPVSDLTALRPGSAALPPVGALPAGIEQALTDYVRAGDPPGVQLQSMLDGLAANGYISHGGTDEPVSRSGHGADRITQLFTDRPMLGDGEQYAVAAALMARELGFPARVVVGFAPAGGGGAQPVLVTGADVSAWIEVETRSEGWVAIDPTPAARAVPPTRPDDPTIVSRPQTVLPPPPDAAVPPVLAPPERTVEDPPAPPDPLIALLLAALAVAGWTLLGLIVVLAPFLAIILAKARRRRLRRRAPTPVEQISGGWREFADTALDFGIDAPGSATRSEVAGTVGGDAPLVLAALVDRAVFSPETATPADADRVWESVAVLRGTLAAARTRRERVRALLSVRSLGGYSGRASVRGKGAGS